MVDVTYRFAELSGEARQRAITWYQQTEHELWEPEFDAIVDVLEKLGIELDLELVNKGQYAKTDGRYIKDATDNFVLAPPRYKPAIHYSIAYGQGDYAAFDGEWHAEHMNVAALLADRPTDARLKRFAAGLMALFLRYPKAKARAYMTPRNGMALDWALTGELDDEDNDVSLDDDDCVALAILMDGLADWIYQDLLADLEYRTSEEAAIEGIEANEYDFDEEGRRV